MQIYKITVPFAVDPSRIVQPYDQSALQGVGFSPPDNIVELVSSVRLDLLKPLTETILTNGYELSPEVSTLAQALRYWIDLKSIDHDSTHG